METKNEDLIAFEEGKIAMQEFLNEEVGVLPNSPYINVDKALNGRFCDGMIELYKEEREHEIYVCTECRSKEISYSQRYNYNTNEVIDDECWTFYDIQCDNCRVKEKIIEVDNYINNFIRN